MEDELELIVPPEVEGGVYSDYLHAWFTAHEVVLDFAAPTFEGAFLANARIRVPATAAVDVAHAVEDCVRTYELQFGEIRRPRAKGEE